MSLVVCVLLTLLAGASAQGAVPIPPFPAASANIGCVAVGTKVYALDSNAFYSLDSADAEPMWSPLAAMPAGAQPTVRCQPVAIAGVIYAIATVNMFTYDTTANVWAHKTASPNPQDFPAVSLNTDTNKILVISGAQNEPKTWVQHYEPLQDAWSLKASKPTGVGRASSEYYAGTTYVDTGREPFGGYIEAYNWAGDVWTSFGSNPFGQGTGSMVYISEISALTIYGGKGTSGEPIGNVIIAGGSESWSDASFPLPAKAQFGWCLQDNNHLYVIGGLDDVGATASSFVFVNYVGPGGSTPSPVVATPSPTAGVSGDPLVAGVRGQKFYVHGEPGVYNMVRTTKFSLNALIDLVVELPPEDNFVITHLAAVLIKGGLPYATLFMDTNTARLTMSSKTSTREEYLTLHKELFGDSDYSTNATTAIEVSLPGATLTVFRRTVLSTTVIRQGNNTSEYPGASWLDFTILPLEKQGEVEWKGLMSGTVHEWNAVTVGGIVKNPWDHLHGTCLADYLVDSITDTGARLPY